MSKRGIHVANKWALWPICEEFCPLREGEVSLNKRVTGIPWTSVPLTPPEIVFGNWCPNPWCPRQKALCARLLPPEIALANVAHIQKRPRFEVKWLINLIIFLLALGWAYRDVSR